MMRRNAFPIGCNSLPRPDDHSFTKVTAAYGCECIDCPIVIRGQDDLTAEISDATHIARRVVGNVNRIARCRGNIEKNQVRQENIFDRGARKIGKRRALVLARETLGGNR